MVPMLSRSSNFSARSVSLGALLALLLWIAIPFSSSALPTDLPSAVAVASGSSVTVDISPYFTASDAPGTVVRMTLVSGTNLANGLPLASGTQTIDIALFDSDAPVTVANFLSYVRSGEFRNSFIHRNGAGDLLYGPTNIIQGGEFSITDGTSDLTASSITKISPHLPILNESSALHSNAVGTIAMARATDLNSAASGWFINTSDNNFPTPYAVFGKLLGNGTSVASQIFGMPTSSLVNRIDGNLDNALTNPPLRTAIPGSGAISSIPRTELVIVQSVDVIPALTYDVSGTSATIGVSAVSPAGLVTFSPGAVSGTAYFTVTATDRDGSPTNKTMAVIVQPPNTTLVSMASGSLTTSGTAGTVPIHIVRTGTAAVTAHYSTQDGSAVAGTDYTPASNGITFTPGGTNDQVVFITIPNHVAPVPGKTFTVQLSLTPASGVALGTATTTAVTLLDSSSNPNGVLQFSQPAYAADGSSTVTVQVTRSGGVSGTVGVVVSTLEGTAMEGRDFQGPTKMVVFGDGDSTPKTVTIPVAYSGVVYGPRTFSVSLSGFSGGATAGTNATSTVTVPPAIQFSSASYSYKGSSGTATVLVKVGEMSGGYSVAYSTADGSAKAGTDYALTTGTLQFLPGDTERAISIPLLAQSDLTPNRNFTISLLGVSENAVIGSVSQATVTIVRSGTGGVFSFASPLLWLTSGSGNLTLVRTSTDQAASVYLNLVDGNSNGGVDNSVSGWANNHGWVQFSSGQQSATIPITTVGGYGSVLYAQLSDASTGNTVGTPATATVYHDVPAQGVLNFDQASYRVARPANQSIQFPVVVNRTGTVPTAVAVTLSTSDGTAIGDVDFGAGSGILNFPAGITTGTITVTIYPTTTPQSAPKTFYITLSNPSGGAVLGSVVQTAVTIVDDTVPHGYFYFVNSNLPFAVESGSAIATVRRSTATGTSTVTYATTDASAVAGIDYSTTSGTLTFLPGQITKAISVPFLTSAATDDRTFNLTLLAASPGSTVGTENQTSITITRSEPAGTFSFQLPSYQVTSLVYQPVTVVRTGPLGQPVTAYVQAIDESGKSLSDFAMTNQFAWDLIQLNFAATDSTATFNIGEYDGRGDRNLTLRIVGVTGSSAIGTLNAANVAFIDRGVVGLAQTSYRIPDTAGTVNVTVNRTGTSGTFTVDWVANGGNAQPGVDYNPPGGTLTFQPGETSKTFPIAIVNNSVTTPRTFTVSLRNTSDNVPISQQAQSAGVQVIDNDNLQGVFQFESASYGFNQNAGWAVLPIVRTGDLSKAADVAVATQDVPGYPGRNVLYRWPAPSSSLSLVVHFEPGQNRQNVFIPLIDGGAASGFAPFFAGIASTSVGNAGFNTWAQVSVFSGAGPAPTVEFANTEYRVNDTDSSIIPQVKLYGFGPAFISAPYHIVPGTAALGTDFIPPASSLIGSVGIAAATRLANLPVLVHHSPSPLGEKRFQIVLDTPSGAGLLGQTTADVAIVNSDAPMGLFEFDSTTPYRCMQDCGAAVLTIVRHGTRAQLSGSARIIVSTEAGTALSSQYDAAGNFFGNLNFAETRQMIGFGPNETAKTFSVEILNGSLAASSANFLVRIASADDGARAGAVDRRIVTIVNPYNPPMAGFAFDKPSYSVNDTGATLRVKVRRFDIGGPGSTLGHTLMVNYATVPGTAKAHSDYTPISGKLKFAPGHNTALLTIHIPARAMSKSRSFTLNLSNPRDLNGPGVVGFMTRDRATVTIHGTASPYGMVQFSKTAYSAAANAGKVMVTLVRSGNLNKAASVQLRSGDASAIAKRDFTEFDQIVRFAAHQSRIQFPVPLTNGHGGAARYFAMELLPTTKGATGALDTATVTLRPAP